MLRTRRATLLLTRALAIGTAVPTSGFVGMSLARLGLASVALTALGLEGCQDESQPEYWVAKLSDNGWRPRAIKQIDQFYEDATTRANGQADAPELKALTEKTVVPLTTTYVEHYDDIDEKARHRLIRLLAIMRDPRTEPALNKAMSEFAEKGRGGEDLKWAARAAADMKLQSVSNQLLQAFLKLRADSEEGGPVYRDLNTAMLALADKSWTKALIDKLEPAMELPAPGEQNKAKVSDFRNQQFWQTTSAQLLGVIGDPAGVEPLLKVVLDPSKANVQPDAYVALVKIGKPAVARASQLLNGTDKELVDFAAARARKAAKGAELLSTDAPHVRTAAIVLGTIGYSSAAPALIGALDGEKNEQNRAVILRELTKLPPSAETKQAFKSGYPSISADGVIPPGQAARPALADAATSFFDPELVPWFLQQTAAAKKDNEAQSALLVAAIKLMTPEQMSAVNAAVDKYGSDLEKGAFNTAAGVLKACGKDAGCYLQTTTKSTNQSEKAQFAGIKAAYMLGVYGNEKTRDQLVSNIDQISNAAIRFTAAKTIDYLSPKGSAGVADQLQKIVDGNIKRGDPDKIAGDAPLKQVIYRVRSRAQA
jgi:HEAT repeat protein